MNSRPFFHLPAQPEQLILLLAGGPDMAETIDELGAALALKLPHAAVAWLDTVGTAATRTTPSAGSASCDLVGRVANWQARARLGPSQTVLIGLDGGTAPLLACLAIDPPLARHMIFASGCQADLPAHIALPVTVDIFEDDPAAAAHDMTALGTRLHRSGATVRIHPLGGKDMASMAEALAERLERTPKAEPTGTPLAGLSETPQLGITFSGSEVAVRTAGSSRLQHLPFGIVTLAENYLRHTPPTALELERAIEEIEPAIMALELHLSPGTTMALDGVEADRLELPATGLDRDEVERLFQRLAAISLGRPASIEGLPVDPRYFAAALVLRELMHHLDVGRVVKDASTPFTADTQGSAKTVTPAGPEPLKKAET